MLKKSFPNAFVMSGLAFLSMLLAFIGWESLRYPIVKKLTTDFQSGVPSNETISIPVAIIILFLVVVLPGALFIRDWSDAYYGKEGAIRWVIFGVIFGTLAYLRTLFPDGTSDTGLSSFLLEKGIGIVLGLIFFYVSHFLAFKVLKRKQGTREQEENP